MPGRLRRNSRGIRVSDSVQVELLPPRFKVVFQTLRGSPYGALFLSVVDVAGVTFQQTHVDRQSVLPGLPRPVDRSRPLHHQPSTCLHMSTDRVFCQVFLGLSTGAVPSTTNLVHAFTCRQTECSARSSSACRQEPSPPPPT